MPPRHPFPAVGSMRVKIPGRPGTIPTRMHSDPATTAGFGWIQDSLESCIQCGYSWIQDTAGYAAFSCVPRSAAFSLDTGLRSAAFRNLRSAAFCVRLRSAFSCVQESAFSCVLRSAAFAFSCVQKSAFSCVQRSLRSRSAAFSQPSPGLGSLQWDA